jgi:hypothetical protein
MVGLRVDPAPDWKAQVSPGQAAVAFPPRSPPLSIRGEAMARPTAAKKEAKGAGMLCDWPKQRDLQESEAARIKGSTVTRQERW